MKNNRISRAFAEIKAEDCLKESTLAFLKQRINQKRRLPVMRLATGFACVLLLFFGGLLSYQSYFTATAYVDIDVNPSIELSLNRYGRVIAASAYNDDGTDLLAEVPLKNRGYRDALQLLFQEMTAQGYIQKAELFSLTLQTEESNRDDLLGELKAILSSLLTDGQRELEQDVFVVDTATKTASHDLHLSPAKYLAIQELQVVDPTATFENCRDHTISKIREQTHMHGNGNQNQNESDSSGHQSENGGANSGEHSERTTEPSENEHGNTLPMNPTMPSDEKHDGNGEHDEHD
ncbi:MAG: hypothetical protein LBU41_00390 [Clostridiales Family XIII bacterium]|nr:hypothetical protein [Clostridiales Family XIII bacterium]